MAKELMTEAEHRVIDLLGEAWSLFTAEVVERGDNYDQDCQEFTHLIHQAQGQVMGQAAARAYPALYRRLGE